MTGVEVTGLRETVRSLEKFGVEVADLKAAFKRIGTIVSTEAQSLAPRLSGKLASTIKPSNTKNKSVIRAGAGIKYAGPINYGWNKRGIAPSYFMENAVTAKQGEVKEQLDTEIHGLIRKLDLAN